MSIDCEDFQYVVQKKRKENVCFGSGCPRDTSALSSFMKYYTLENHPGISPNTYNVLESFKAIKTKPSPCSISKNGYSGIARYAKKMVFSEKLPSPNEYNIPTFPKIPKESIYPFDCSSRRDRSSLNKNPGPGTYTYLGKKEISSEHNFGGRVKMRLGVDLKCCNRNTDFCNICREIPIGDYWHLNNQIFMCRSCMAEARRKRKQHKKDELILFRKVRDCSGIHCHEGTSAKIWLRNPKKVKKWIQKEAYLANYFND